MDRTKTRTLLTFHKLTSCLVGAVVLCLGGGGTAYGWTAQTLEAPPVEEPSRIVEFDSDRWQLNDRARIVTFGGRRALAGDPDAEITDYPAAYLKDLAFLNGTIEVDVWIAEAVNFAGFMFRVQSFDEYEWCWLRTAKTNGLVQDGLQYAPAFKGVACWQLNGGPGGIGPVNVPKNEWVHMKMEILNATAALYVKDMTKPVLIMDHLKLGLKRGSVGLQTSFRQSGVYFSNFAYRIDDRSQVIPPRAEVVPPNVLDKWRLSPPYPIQDFDAVSTYPADRLNDLRNWIAPDVAVSGLVNVTRYHGRPGGLGIGAKPDCAILRTYIDAQEDKRVKMTFGYSDAVAIFLNRDPLFWGNSAFTSRNKADGEWISFNDAVFLNLKKGRNELLAVVAEVFGGWGFQARLDHVDGIAVRTPAEER